MAELMTNSNTFIVSTSKFEENDLEIFLESIEILSRIEKMKYERTQRRRNRKFTIYEKADGADEDDFLNFKNQLLECPKEIEKCENSQSIGSLDENYYSGSNTCSNLTTSESETEFGSNECVGHHTNISQLHNKTFIGYRAPKFPELCKDISPILSSDEDYGSYTDVVSTENIASPSRPRSQVITNPRYRTTRARIIGLVLKKEYVNGGGVSMNDLDTARHSEKLIDDLLKEKERALHVALPKGCRVARSNSGKLLDKALRYLTL